MNNNPRFRTLHEAGKYISAQLYPAARGLNPEEFGAVPRYIENPEWAWAQFEVGEPRDMGLAIIDHGVHQCIAFDLKTSAEWYQLYPEPVILLADGWDNPLSYSWFQEKISQTEFELRRNRSVRYE